MQTSYAADECQLPPRLATWMSSVQDGGICAGARAAAARFAEMGFPAAVIFGANASGVIVWGRDAAALRVAGNWRSKRTFFDSLLRGGDLCFKMVGMLAQFRGPNANRASF